MRSWSLARRHQTWIFGFRLLRFKKQLAETLAKEAQFPLRVTEMEVNQATSEIWNYCPSPKLPYKNYQFTLPYDALPLMISRKMIPILSKRNPQPLHVFLKFPSFLPDTTHVFRQIFKPWETHVTCSTSLDEMLAQRKTIDPQESCLLFMGSKQIFKEAENASSQYGRVIYMGPTGIQSIVLLEDVQDVQELNKIAKFTIHRAFLNAGQYCMGSKRLFVPTSLFPTMVEKLQKELKEYPVGDPLDPNTLCSNSLVSHKYKRFEEQQALLSNLGDATVTNHSICRIIALPQRQLYVRTPEWWNELDPFGPVLIVQEYETESDLCRGLKSGSLHSNVFISFGDLQMGKESYLPRLKSIIERIPNRLENPNIFNYSSPQWKSGSETSLHFVSTLGSANKQKSFCMQNSLLQDI